MSLTFFVKTVSTAGTLVLEEEMALEETLEETLEEALEEMLGLEELVSGVEDEEAILELVEEAAPDEAQAVTKTKLNRANGTKRFFVFIGFSFQKKIRALRLYFRHRPFENESKRGVSEKHSIFSWGSLFLFRKEPSAEKRYNGLMKSVIEEYYSARKTAGLYVGTLEREDPVTLRVLRYVNEAFAEQKDRGGYPYIYHLLYVASHVDEDAIRVALLHDAMEDQGATKSSLLSLGISEKEVDAVDALTRKGGEETPEGYFAYVKRIRETNPLAFKVKQADLLMNADLRRLKQIRPQDIDRSFKYEAALLNRGALYLHDASLLNSDEASSFARHYFASHPIPEKESECQEYAKRFLQEFASRFATRFEPTRTGFILLRELPPEKKQDLFFAQAMFLLALLHQGAHPGCQDFTPSSYVKDAYDEIEQEYPLLLLQQGELSHRLLEAAFRASAFSKN